MADIVHESLELDGYWKIVWFGKLTNVPASNNRSLYITTYLRRLVIDSHHSIKHGKTTGTYIVVYVPVGELARLQLGTLVHNGSIVANPYKHFDYEKLSHKTLNLHRSNITVFDRFHRHNGELVIPSGRSVNDGSQEHNNLFIGIGEDDDPYKYVIPCVEVFRFFYGTSSVLAKALLSDQFLDPDAHLWSTKASQIDLNTGQAVIWLRRRMLDSDARFLARFAFDQYALKMAHQIFLHAAATRHPSSERMIFALPPLQGSIEAKFYVKPNGDNRFMVTRLISCDWAPLFRYLKWDRDNDGRTSDNKTNQDPPQPPGRGWYSPQPNIDSPEPEYLSTQMPSEDVEPSRLTEDEISQRFPRLSDIPAEKLPQLTTGPKTEPKNTKVFLQQAFGGSVLDGISSGSLVGKTVIEASEQVKQSGTTQTDEVDASKESNDYLTILDHLRNMNEHNLAEVEYIVVSDSMAQINGIDFNVYPRDIDGKQLAWLYVDEDKRCRRMALLAKITKGDNIRYLLELQQKKAKDFSTLVFWVDTDESISTGVLQRVFMDCAYAQAARLDEATVYGVLWGRLKHTTPRDIKGETKQTEHFLQRIFDAKPVPSGLTQSITTSESPGVELLNS